MKHFLYVLKKSVVANTLFVFALVITLLFEIIFYNTVELFYGGAKLAGLLTSISLSYIAGYIFYISTETRRRANDIRSTALIAHRHCGRVISLVNDIFYSITEKREIPSERELDDFLAIRKIHEKVPGIVITFDGKSSQFVEYNYYYPCYIFPKMQGLESDVANISHLIEPEVSVALDNIFNCNFKSLLGNRMVSNINHGEATLSMFKDAFDDLSRKTNDLNMILYEIYGDPPWASNK